MMRLNSNKGSESNRALLGRLFRFGWNYRLRAAQIFSLQVLQLLLAMAGLGFTGLAVDTIRRSIDKSAPDPHWPFGLTPPQDWSAVDVLSAIGAAVVFMAVVRALLNFAYGVLEGHLIHREMVPDLRAELFTRLQQLSFRFFDANSTGGIINRLTRDVQMLRAFVDGVLVQSSILLLSLGVFLIYMLATHVRLTLVSLALTPLLYVATSVFSRWAQPAFRQNRNLADRMVRAMAEGIEGIQVTKVFGREQEQYRRFQRRNLAVRQQQRKIFKNVSRFAPGIDFLNQSNIAVLLAYGGYLVAAREITLGDLVVFAGLLQQFTARASGMANIVNTLQQSLTSARRVFEILDAPVEVRSLPGAKLPGKLRGKLEFRGVGFGYSSEQRVLSDIHLSVEPGQCVGVLGLTGSGKSTLLSLVPRFYDPTEGQLLIDDVDVRELDLDAMRRQIGIVFQESLLFRDTVAANIAYGMPEATPEQVERAARQSGAHQFVMELSAGYETVLEEGAMNLSGGQRQRLAIARALLLEPAILVLDDPTTAIDPKMEAEVLRAVDGAIAGRTTLIVSNRLSALMRADLIIVLSGGRIVERGTHLDLLAADGVYRRAAEIQGLDDQSRELLQRQGALA